ncbi:hypothetical protein [Mycobacterium sp. 852013-50091_SCH5140682]|uniref:hypothetical protein n=1 Tax=Mycobacterium sp. 852013-50091_SCH5140682 TaxID=1834109 RepID=UPI0012E9C78B|nr:hypothetical protein [Mycobacterium sp. 852013-50091_SCH5140682]
MADVAASVVAVVAPVSRRDVAVTGVEDIDGWLAGIETGTVRVSAGTACAPSVTFVACAAGWPEVSDEADDVDVVASVENAELGLSGLMPDTVVVVMVLSAV